jgi:hypothetical protein
LHLALIDKGDLNIKNNLLISATRIHHNGEVNGKFLKLNETFLVLKQAIFPKYLLYTFSHDYVLKVLINFSYWQQQKLGKSI